jgi:D-arabinose 1-dehydrogenase-like Zn-dependent alcohol dehydrogenase
MDTSTIFQVIINDVSPHMQVVEHAVLKRYEQSSVFAVCADHCINLLLENIVAFNNVKDVLTKAKEITFTYRLLMG